MSQTFFTKEQFNKVKSFDLPEEKKLRVLTEMIRYNILGVVMEAGSGHLGASLSAAEVMTLLYHQVMKINPDNHLDPKRDIYVLSKGHAGPMLISELASVGLMPHDDLFKFRKLHGPQGHVDIETPGVEANTGALGMGIAKGKGQAIAFKKQNKANKVFVMVGDGELQEGQNWEGFQSAPAWKLDNLVVLLDKNKVQSDLLTTDILDIAAVEGKLKAFGWEVLEVDGHNLPGLISLFKNLDYSNGKPKVVILDTIKGKGISFMEHPYAMAKDGLYLWHNKVPSQEEYEQAINEVDERIKNLLNDNQIEFPELKKEFEREKVNWTEKSVKQGYSEGLVELVKANSKIIVLDGDLAVDCGIKVIEENYPNNFLEVGIAEQDMVGIAGGLARQGYLPIVNTFAAFLTARANEQIYNNQTEHTKIIYVGHLAGLIPATPGKSHQAVRDIGLMRTMPEMVLFEPCSYEEAEMAIKYLAQENKTSSYLRLAICNGLREIALPKGYKIEPGRGFRAKDGKDIAIIAYGPIMLSQALAAAEILEKEGKSVKVINLPWLNNIDANWLAGELKEAKQVFSIDDHVIAGGQGEEIVAIANKKFKDKKIVRFGLKTFPESGQVMETLKHFELDGLSIAERIIKEL